MNNLFNSNSPLDAAFNDIFGQTTNAKPQPPVPVSTTKGLPTVARIGAARQVNISTKGISNAKATSMSRDIIIHVPS